MNYSCIWHCNVDPIFFSNLQNKLLAAYNSHIFFSQILIKTEPPILPYQKKIKKERKKEKNPKN